MEVEKISFEGALARLEEVVRRLEDGNLSLDESLALYEEGIKLLKFCEAELHRAEGAVEVLTKTETREAWLDDEGH
jgi:exodeoxyribonuclease VII small subunit